MLVKLCYGSVAILLSALLIGCASRPLPALDASSADEVGEVLVSVSAVAPLGQYIAAFDADFELTPAAALELAVPLTQSSVSRLLDAVRGGVSVARDVTAKPAAPANPVSSVTEAAPVATQSALFPADNKIGIDPILHYQSAMRLMAEVKMMNRALRDLPFDPAREQAHLVQLNVTLMPHHDSAPYDAYLTLTAPEGMRLYPAHNNDSVEISQQQWVRNVVRGLNLSATGVFSAIATSLGLSTTQNRLDELAATALSGITSAGSVTEQKVRVRIGATNRGINERYLAGRSHTVFAIIVSDSSKRDVKLEVASHFRKINTSARLLEKNEKRVIDLHLESDGIVFDVDSKSASLKHDGEPMRLYAERVDPKKDDLLVVRIPAWNVRYLGDLRAIVYQCGRIPTIGDVSADKHRKSLDVRFRRSSECKRDDKDFDKSYLVVEKVRRVYPRESSPKQVVAVHSIVALPVERAEAPAAEKASCVAGDVIRSTKLVTDKTGNAKLTAYADLKQTKASAHDGSRKSIPIFLSVTGADLRNVNGGPTVRAGSFKGRAALLTSGTFELELGNVVPGDTVTIEVATYESDSFKCDGKYDLIPVSLAIPRSVAHD